MKKNAYPVDSGRVRFWEKRVEFSELFQKRSVLWHVNALGGIEKSFAPWSSSLLLHSIKTLVPTSPDRSQPDEHF